MKKLQRTLSLPGAIAVSVGGMLSGIFVLPGLGGLAISEAMCYSLPILCSIGDGCEVDLVNKKNGIIEKDMTPENIAKHIEHLIKQDLKSMGSESLRIILERYNTKNYVRKIIESIE